MAAALAQPLISHELDKLAVRLLHPGECVPPNLQHGLPIHFVPPQPDWIWIAHRNYHSLAMLIAAPAQNLAFLMRICTESPRAATYSLVESSAALVILLRTALADMYARGYEGYCVDIDPATPAGRKLLEVLRAASKGSPYFVEHASMVKLGGPTNGNWQQANGEAQR